MKYDICVFGGCSLDMMFYGREDGTFSEVPDKMVPGGKAANQAVAAARAGAKVAIITRLGKDKVGERIVENLQYNGVFTNNVEIVDGLENDSANIFIDPITKDNEIVRKAGAIDSFEPGMIERYKDVILSSKVVVAQLKVPKEVTVELIEFCHKHNKPLILTPCRPDRLKITEGNNKELIDKISFITANQKECATIFGTDNVEECVRRYPNKLIVTLGEKGVMYFDGINIQVIPSIPVKDIKDTTGAGDTFNGNLAYALTHGYDLKTAIIRAQYASAMKIQVETAQAGMPFQEELDTFIQHWNLKQNEYVAEFDLAYQGILAAYERIRTMKTTKVEAKPDKTFVTEADLIVEEVLINAIRKRFPDDNFVTEETNNQNEVKGRTWIIDPIDGTSHYMKDSLFFGIQLCFVDEGETKFSILYLPKVNELYYASKGNGVYLNHKKLSVRPAVDVAQCTVEFCGSLHKKTEEKRRVLSFLMNSEDRVANFVHINACCWAFANLVSGRTDALVLSTIKPWDIMPGMMLAKEMGMEPIIIGSQMLFTNNSELAKAIVNGASYSNGDDDNSSGLKI